MDEELKEDEKRGKDFSDKAFSYTEEHGLEITKKYFEFLGIIYNTVTNLQNKHRVVREELLKAMFLQLRLFHEAAKSNQKSKLYLADSNLSHIRDLLRFYYAKGFFKNEKKYFNCIKVLGEVGKILGSWIKNRKG